MNTAVLLLVAALLPAALGSRVLAESYEHSLVLLNKSDSLYDLYWSFNRKAETISFAVRVKTTGWVGFGLSPNGGMTGSDIVIGWVDDDGKAFLHVSLVFDVPLFRDFSRYTEHMMQVKECNNNILYMGECRDSRLDYIIGSREFKPVATNHDRPF